LTSATSVPTVESVLAQAEATLTAAQVETPRADAEWLLAGILDVGRAALAVNRRHPLDAASAQRYDEAIRRRARREPVQRILGWEEFHGLRFHLTPDVLVPRPETELLVEWALECLPAPIAGRRPRAIDVGTGSGCIACALAHDRRDVAVAAIDVSTAAAAVARRNAEALGVDVRTVVADLTEPVAAESVDLLVANLPYIPISLIGELAPEVTEHEPRLALAGGVDGLDVIRRFIPDACRVLRRRGVVVLETLGAAQGATVATLLSDAGFVDVVARDDLARITRCVAGRRA
jgi:release factor glutamine methyltransferase